MSCEALGPLDLSDLARDPLVRLVMASDGVTEAELMSLLRTAQRAVNARTVLEGDHGAGRRRRPGIRRTIRM